MSTEPSEGAVPPDGHGVGRAAEHHRRLGVRELLPYDQPDKLSVLGAESTQGSVKFLAPAICSGPHVGCWLGFSPNSGKEALASLTRPPMARHHLPGDAVQPETIVRFRGDIRSPAPRRGEHLGD